MFVITLIYVSENERNKKGKLNQAGENKHVWSEPGSMSEARFFTMSTIMI